MSTSAPFDAVAESYDDVFSGSPIGQAQRKAIWSEMDRVFHPGQHILEINCGTGIDAVHLARRGVAVTACDSSGVMIEMARSRVEETGERLPISFFVRRTEDMSSPSGPEREGFCPFDGVLSNFSGLNCISDLQTVACDLAALVRPGGKAMLCVFGRCCLWEILWHLRAGDPRKAIRRLRRQSIEARLTPEVSVQVHYHSPRDISAAFAPWFRLERRIGVGIAVPPSYALSIPRRFPRLFKLAARTDPLLGRAPILKSFADHVVLTLVRTREPR
jgi:ubiquinone/menaquinone biosynthesis C-methylase UbiE